MLYAIGRQAVPVLTARLGVSTGLIQQRRIGKLDVRSVDHDLQASRLWAHLHRFVPTNRLTGWRWTPERTLRAQRLRVKPRGSRFPLPFLPDAYVEFDYPSGAVQCCVVEIDNGTLPLRRFRHKVRAFEAFQAEGLFEDWSGRDEFEVLILVPSMPRLRHLRGAARDEVDQDRWEYYSFATFDALGPNAFPYGWWPLEREDEDNTCGLFFDQAYEAGGYGPDDEPEFPKQGAAA